MALLKLRVSDVTKIMCTGPLRKPSPFSPRKEMAFLLILIPADFLVLHLGAEVSILGLRPLSSPGGISSPEIYFWIIS